MKGRGEQEAKLEGSRQGPGQLRLKERCTRCRNPWSSPQTSDQKFTVSKHADQPQSRHALIAGDRGARNGCAE